MENLVPIIESPHRQDAVTLVRVNNPLNPMIDRQSKVIDYFGENLLTIKDNYFPKNLPVVTSVNGKIIPKYDLDKITLKHGDYLVFYPTIEGEGAGGMRMIAFLALAIISAIVAPYLTAAMGGSMTVGGVAGGALTSTGMMVSGMMGMAINFVGGMIINALLPPTTPEQESSGSSNAYSFSPHSTQAQGIPLPKLYGTFKSHGNIITAFNYNVKDKSTANILVSFGTGPVEDIYDYKINDQRMGNTKDITFGERHGELRQEVIPAFTETKSENPYSLRIKHIKDWIPTQYKESASVLVYDTAGQGWKFTALNDGIWVDYVYTFPAEPYVEGDTYWDANGGVNWVCEGKYPYETVTVGNDFDALEVEFNFPRGLVSYDDEGNPGRRTVEVDVQISPSGKDTWYSITRRAKTMTNWAPNMAITEDSIISSPEGNGIYKVLFPSSATRTGTKNIQFNTQPMSCTVESASTTNTLDSWAKAYIGNSTGPTNGTYTDDNVNVAPQLNGNVLNNGYSLALNTTGKYLYCLIDEDTVNNISIGFHLMYYVLTGASGAVNLKAEYWKKGGATGPSWEDMSGDGQNLATDEDFSFSGDPISFGKTKAKSWAPKNYTGYGYGHWVRFSFNSTSNGYPIMGLFRPQKANVGARDGIIVYTESRKDYSYSDPAPDNGTWSAGYWTTSSGFLEDYNIWVEVDATTDHDFGSHNNGDRYEGSGWKTDWDVKGATWRYITTSCYVLFKKNMERTKKFGAGKQSSVFFVVRSPTLYPHGYYDIRVERVSNEANPNSTSTVDEMYLSNIREIVYDDFSYPRHALLGVKALATENLSGSLDLSAIVKGLVTQVNRPDEVIGSDGYNYRCKTYLPSPTTASHKPITGSSWSTYWEQAGSGAVDNNIAFAEVTNYSATSTWITEFTTNPAWVCYDILSQPVIGMPAEVIVSNIAYECVVSNTAATINAPPTGQDWSKYWQVSGDIGIGDTWTAGTIFSARPILRYEGINPSRLDLTSFKTLADYCDELVYDESGTLERRHEFNGIFDAELTLWEAALKVTEMCRSSLIWNGMNIAIVTDKSLSLPTGAVQLFTSGNILPDSFKETFLPMEERVTEMEITFNNRAKDWERDTISIYNPDSDSLSNKASIEPLGITKASQAWRHAQYLINRNKYLKKTIEFETDLEAIACTVGDVFYFQNDVPRWGMAGGRLASTSHDGMILQLDQNITLSSTGSYGMMVRHNDDTLETKEISTLLGPEILINGDFELGSINVADSAYGWTDTAYSTITIKGGGKYGNYLELAANGYSYQSFYQALTGKLVDGHKYKMSYWAKNGTLATGTDIVLSDDGGFTTYRSSTLATSSSWQRNYLDFVYTLIPGYGLNFYVEKTDANIGTVLYDEISLREILTDKPIGSSLLTDGSFEGSLVNWTTSNCTITNTAITGIRDKGLQMTITGGTYQQIYQSNSTIAGKRYRASVWVKNGTATLQVLRLDIWGAAQISYLDITSDTYWKQLTLDFTATGATTTVYLTKTTSTTGTVLWDECRLYELESAAGDTVEVTTAFGTGIIGQTNLVSNGTFETGTAEWTAINCTLASVTGGQDSNCLQITSTGGTSQYVYQYFYLIVGKSYRLSCYVKSGTSGDDDFTIAINETGTDAHQGVLNETSSSSWVRYSVDFVCTQSYSYALLQKSTTHAASPGTMLFDEVELYEIAYPTQYAPYSVGTLNSEAKAFRAINISQSSEQRAKITAIEYDADVYADDLEVATPDTGDTWVEPVAIKPVTDLILMEIPSVGTPDTIGARNIAVFFKRPEDDLNYRTARVWYKFNRIDDEEGNDAWALLQETSGTNATITSVLPNYRYTVCVTSVSKDNVEALWDESPKASYVVSDTNMRRNFIHDFKVSGLQIVGNPNSITFIGNDCGISWNPIVVLPGSNIAGGVAKPTSLMESGIAFNTSDSDSLLADSYRQNPSSITGIGSRFYDSPNAKGAGTSIPQSWFKDYEVKVYNYNTGALLRTEYVTDPLYNYTYSKNYQDNYSQLAKKLQIEVKARDANLNSSLPISIIAYNPNLTVTSTGSSSLPYVHLRDEKSSGTTGGPNVLDTWTQRTLNTEKSDTNNLCTLSSNRFVLSAGTYQINARVPHYAGNLGKAKLYNYTTSADVIMGSSAFAQAGYNAYTDIIIQGTFTSNGSDSYELRHIAADYDADGFGRPTSQGTEVYAEVWLTKIS